MNSLHFTEFNHDESGSLFKQVFQGPSVTSDSTGQRRRESVCQGLIPLVKEEEKAYAKGSYTTLKLRSNPAEENSPIYEIQVPYFKSGTCEQYLEFMDKVQACDHQAELDYGTSESCIHAISFEGRRVYVLQ